MKLRVIGIGSPDGDDAIGLAVARALRREPLPDGVEVLERSRPGLDLLDALCGIDGAVIVDALSGAGPVGEVRCLNAGELAAGPRSSHAIGVAEALALGSALERDVAPLRIVAICVGSAATSAPGAPLCAALREAIAPACARVRAELRALCSWGGSPQPLS